MIRKIREALEQREEGFTLIELLVVVIIIGILAAIAIPTFLNQRRSSWIASAEADARNAALEVESFVTSSATNSLPTDDAAGFGSLDVELSPGVALDYVIETDGVTYCLVATHTNIDAGATTVAVYESDAGGLQTDVACNDD